MRLDFIQAVDDTPLTKRYKEDSDGNKVKVSSYPHIRDLNSTSVHVNDLSEMYDAIVNQADLGFCLLKGHLSKELKNESRAGKTLRNNATEWVVFDMDFEDGYSSVDEFLESIDPALKGIDYIFHHSSSAGIEYKAGIRGHVFMLLEKPQLPSIMKEWFTEKNQLTEGLKSKIRLGANGQSIIYPLDTSTCDNSKLIFIAAPQCDNFIDPLDGARFELRLRGKGKLDINFNTANAEINKARKQVIINDMRKTAGLPKRAPKFRTKNGEELLTNPDVSIVTGEMDCGDFVRLNLTDSDSWGYWYYKDDPSYLYNFKDMPIVRMKDIVPDYYSNLFDKVENTGNKPVVFRDIATDQWYNGFFNGLENTLQIYSVSNLQKIQHFLTQNGSEMPEYIEDYEYVFNPTVNKVIDFKEKWANKFSPTSFMRDTKVPAPQDIPATIDKVLSSICVDDETKEHFLNWLAFIFQTRKKTATAWIFHGRTGTGKGILFERILQPLIGDNYCHEYTLANLEDTFNQNLEKSIIMFIDEFNISDSQSSMRMRNKIFNLITENSAMIRGMRKEAVQRKIYNNIIIATNHANPVPLEENDRRFNVAPAQEKMLQINDEVNNIPHELPHFAAYLREYQVDELRVRKILDNEARKKMIDTGKTSIDMLFNAIREGDLNYFVTYLNSGKTVQTDPMALGYQKVVTDWVRATEHDTNMVITRDELMVVYQFLQGATISPNKFTSLCKKQRINFARIQHDGQRVSGLNVNFKGASIEDLKEVPGRNVIPLSK